MNQAKKQARQQRYKTKGGASGLIKVEVLVPPSGRQEILKRAAALRSEHRSSRTHCVPSSPAEIEKRVRAACQGLPRRYTAPADINRLVVTSVNVPFPRKIDAETLASGLRTGRLPSGFTGHFERFLGEETLSSILRFCDRNGIGAAALARFVRANRETLALRRPELENHLDALVPGF